MEYHGTAFPNWYITFQQAALAALPRPPEIDQDTALGWTDNGEAMQRAFLQFLVPPTPPTRLIIREKILFIDRTTPFNPAEFIGMEWSIWRGPADGDGLSGEEDQDERSLELKEIDTAKILLETCLQDEKSMTGEEQILRLKSAGRIRLDSAIFYSLWHHHWMIPKEWEKKINGYTACIFFDGTPLRSPDGDRCTLCLYFEDDRWGWHCCWLVGDRDVGGPSAVLASISRVSNDFVGSWTLDF